MLHSNKNCPHAATILLHTGTITGVLLIFVAALEPLSAQTGDPLGFESRFFFKESPSFILPQESASPRTMVIQRYAPTSSEHKLGSQEAQITPSSAHNLLIPPAAAAPHCGAVSQGAGSRSRYLNQACSQARADRHRPSVLV
jgi:hypothetical protein